MPKPSTGFLSLLSAPARRALENKGIKTLKHLSGYSEPELMELHGIGKTTIPRLRAALEEQWLSFKQHKAPAQPVTKTSEPEKVTAFMKQLDHPLKKVAEALRKLILKTDKLIGEEIAWNAPAFFYTGAMKPFNPKEYKRFIVVFNFYKKDCMRLIFLTGAKVNDTSGLLEGNYTDGRRIASFHTVEEVKAKEKTLQTVIRKWLVLLEK